MNSLDTETMKHLTWFVMGAIMEYLASTNSDNTATSGDDHYLLFSRHMRETLPIMVKTAEAGDARHLNGSCSDFQCTLGMEVLKRFCNTNNKGVYF